jgi:hypothetical protein
LRRGFSGLRFNRPGPLPGSEGAAARDERQVVALQIEKDPDLSPVLPHQTSSGISTTMPLDFARLSSLNTSPMEGVLGTHSSAPMRWIPRSCCHERHARAPCLREDLKRRSGDSCCALPLVASLSSVMIQLSTRWRCAPGFQRVGCQAPGAGADDVEDDRRVSFQERNPRLAGVAGTESAEDAGRPGVAHARDRLPFPGGARGMVQPWREAPGSASLLRAPRECQPRVPAACGNDSWGPRQCGELPFHAVARSAVFFSMWPSSAAVRRRGPGRRRQPEAGRSPAGFI